MKEFLESLTKEKILREPLPIQQLISNSLYYPSAGVDGKPVQFFAKEYQSFVYCDYGVEEEVFLKQIDSFHGYSVLAQRHVSKEEITPDGWRPEIPPGLTMHDYFREKDFIKKPFANWAVYERKPEKDQNHGPERFSVLYIGGEGVATYQAVFWTHQHFSSALALIHPGAAWGGNWANFEDSEGPFAWVMLTNPHGKPEKIIMGESRDLVGDLNWPGYRYSHSINHYDSGRGVLSVYEKVEE